MIIMLTCSGRKGDKPTRAIDLYIGNHFSMAKQIAQLLTKDKNIYILSALHGILRADDIIAPYQKRLGEPDSVTREKVEQQAKRMRISNKPVLFIGGDAYLALIDGIFPSIVDFLDGQRNIFDQKHLMKQTRERLQQHG